MEFKELLLSDDNKKFIKKIVMYRVYKQTGKTINVVTDNTLTEILNRYYTMRGGEDKVELDHINYFIINKLTVDGVNGIIDNEANTFEIFNPGEYEQLPTPVSTHVTKQSRGNADIMFGDLWKYV